MENQKLKNNLQLNNISLTHKDLDVDNEGIAHNNTLNSQAKDNSCLNENKQIFTQDMKKCLLKLVLDDLTYKAYEKENKINQLIKEAENYSKNNNLEITKVSSSTVENIKNSVLDELIVTDTIPLRSELAELGKIRQLSVAEMLAETIRRIAAGESVRSLYVD
jgi:hypothetical protein